MANFVIVCTSLYRGETRQVRLIRFWENSRGPMFTTSLCEKKTIFPDRSQAERAAHLLAGQFGKKADEWFEQRFRVRNIETLGAALRRQLPPSSWKNCSERQGV